ncbi:MAG: phage head closure protein [Nitrosarchaeum sp.]
MVATARYRHYITIQSQVVTQNKYGENEISWVDDSECFAEIKPIKGDEYYNARQIQSVVTHKITMRYTTLSDGTRIKQSNSRIKFGDRIFNIEGVINLMERNIDLELMVVEEL